VVIGGEDPVTNYTLFDHWKSVVGRRTLFQEGKDFFETGDVIGKKPSYGWAMDDF